MNEVRCLLCHAHVAMAIACLGSMRRACAEEYRLVLHDDGTLTQEDCERLMAQLSPVAIIRRPEADERMSALLADLPNARRYRLEQVYALKLFDLPLLSSAERLTIIDSDVLFLRRFSGLFSWQAPMRFMADDINAYSLRPWQVLKFPLPARLNAGITQFYRGAYDVEYLEWFVGQQQLHAIRGWIEQTAWAMLAQRQGCAVIDEDQVRLTHPRIGTDTKAVALHFVTPQRGLLPRFIEATEHQVKNELSVEIRDHLPGLCRPSVIAWERLRHALSAGVFSRH